MSLQNREEQEGFLKNALAWQGSVSPKILPRVLVVALYSSVFTLCSPVTGFFILEMTPFEFSGFALGLLLVFRTNAGYDRWWEARKLWGSIVNQSRNLASIGSGYVTLPASWHKTYLSWVAAFPHVIRRSLRGERDLVELIPLLGESEVQKISQASHMPLYVSRKIIQLLKEAREQGAMDGFVFQLAEKERGLLLDATGACERILKTPMPLIFAIKARRFILLFLILLPCALLTEIGWLTPVVCSMVGYILFSLDQIGLELQNPFSQKNLSHLPLDEICKNIERNVLSVENILSNDRSQ